MAFVYDAPQGGRLAGLLKRAEEKSARFNRLMESGNDMTKAEAGEASQLSAELKELKAQVKDLHEAAGIAHEFKSYLHDPASPFAFGGRATPSGTAEVDSARGTMKGIKGLDHRVLSAISTKSYDDAWHEYMRKGIHGMSEGGRKALVEGADASGGFLVPEQVQQMLVQKRATPTRIYGMVRQWTTGRDELTFPQNIWGTDDIYTSPVRMTKTGEVPASSSTAQQTDPSFGLTRIQVYTYMVNGQITRDLLEDALFDMQAFLVEKYSEASDVLKDLKILQGTGIGEATGILANPGGTVAGQTQPAIVSMGNPITGAGVLGLAYAVPEQYDENCMFFMNKVNGLRTIATLTDNNGRFLFSGPDYGNTGVATARPKQLVGYPYVLSGLMPDPGSNAFPVIFGDPTGYYLVERVGLSIQVLDQTKATLNQIELVGRLRFGGQPVEYWKLKVGQQH